MIPRNYIRFVHFVGALHFKDEANSTGLFKSCCDFGKVKLQKKKMFPKYLRDLYDGNNDEAKKFRRSIRAFNLAFSFASIGAQIQTTNNGPYVFKTQ